MKLVLLATLLALPLSANAASVNALETIAGIGTEVSFEDFDAKTVGNLVLTSPTGSVEVLPIATNLQGEGTRFVPGHLLSTAGTYTVAIERGYETLSTSSLTVHPDALDAHKSSMQLLAQRGGEASVLVTLVDRFSNPLSGRLVELISSNTADRITSSSKETNSHGEILFTIQGTKDISALRAMDLLSSTVLDQSLMIASSHQHSVGGPLAANLVGSQASTVEGKQFSRGKPVPAEPISFGASILDTNFRANLGSQGEAARLDSFDIQVLRGRVPVNMIDVSDFYDIQITALDQFAERFLDYEGTVYLYSTDEYAELPKEGAIEFTFGFEGQRYYTLGLQLSTPGKHTLIISDHPTNPQNVLGRLDIEVTGQEVVGPEFSMNITSPAPEVTLNETDVLVTGNGPPFINIIIEGGKETVTDETDRDGNFAVPIALDETRESHTITVKDKDGRHAEDTVNFSIDITPPAITSVTFMPEAPTEETDVLVIVESEPNLENVSMQFGGETFELITTDPTSGKYQVLFTAPAGKSVHTPEFTVTDAYGNSTSENSASFSTILRDLPIVPNLRTTSEINAVGLNWDLIDNPPIDAYRIYVGVTPDEFLYTLDTDRPTDAATVAGLQPGATYYFAVTALQGERESAEKSAVAQATVLGVELKVAPGDGSLLIEWDSLTNDIPLSSFVLEYGAEEDNYTEKRTLNGELRAFTLRDLINEVTYYLQLTPITSTGEVMEDLAATGQGTPLGAGFTTSANDPVPPEFLATFAGAPDIPSNLPPAPPPVEMPLSEEGVPLWILFSILGMSVVLLKFQFSRRHVAPAVTYPQMDIQYLG